MAHTQLNSEISANKLPEKMNAYLYYGPSNIRLESILTPKVNEEELLVKIEYSLTSGSSLKAYKRGHPVLVNKDLPSPFGHQLSGVVVEVGKKTKNFSVGDKVIVMNTAPCGECHYCKRKRYSLCENLTFLNGAYAEYIKIPEKIVKKNTHKIPENLNFKLAALTESVAVVMHGIERSKVEKGKTVCIIGTGPIGLLFTAISKSMGAKVITIGRSGEKLKLAKELGADYTFENTDCLEEEIKKVTNGSGPEIVVEAVGKTDTWDLATKIVAKGGLVNFFGGCKKGSTVEIDTFKLHYEELELIGVFHHTPDFVRQSIQLLSNEGFQALINNKIITHEFPLNRLEEALLLQEKGEAIQIAIKP